MILFYFVVIFIIILLNVLFTNVLFRKQIEKEIIQSVSKTICVDENQFVLDNTFTRLEVFQVKRKDGTKGCQPFKKDDVDFHRCNGLDLYQKSSPCNEAFFYLLSARVLNT